jgi:hypothetical protein
MPGKGRRSLHQEEFKTVSKKHGLQYIIARSIDDVVRRDCSQQKAPAFARALVSPAFVTLVVAVEQFAGLVFCLADGVLSLTFYLISLTFGFRLRIASHFADAFLDIAFDVGSSAFNPILIHFRLHMLWGNNQQQAERLPAVRVIGVPL